MFDLDNTLYPAGSDLWPKIDARITVFLAHIFGLDGLSSRALQKYYYQRYGTTLRGLMEEHGSPPTNSSISCTTSTVRRCCPIHALASAITRAAGTQAHPHQRVARARAADRREARHPRMFEDIFDIVAADLLPKPAAETYQRFFDRHAVDPSRAAMFEDIAHNLAVPHARGMATVLVVPKPEAGVHREPWELAGANAAHVEFVTNDLEAFLTGLGHQALQAIKL